MDKLSEYIPIIVILISLVISIAGKKKKAEKVTRETTLPGTTLEETINKKVFQRPGRDLNQVFIDDIKKKQTIKNPEITNTKEILPSFSPAGESVEIEEENTNLLFSFDNEDDVRQAIIYAEIINKKEY